MADMIHFKPPHFRSVPASLRDRPMVRNPDFVEVDAPTVALVLEEDRIDAGLRSKRIRVVQIGEDGMVTSVPFTRSSDGNWLMRAWEWIRPTKEEQ